MVVTRSMTRNSTRAIATSHINAGRSELEEQYKRTAAGAVLPHPQLRYPPLRTLRDSQDNNDTDSNLTVLPRTSIVATPVDWLPDIIVSKCQEVIENYEISISHADDTVVLDRVRRAFNLVRAQACMLATLFIQAIQTFLLPALQDTWHAVLEQQQDLDKTIANIDRTMRMVEVTADIDEAIIFFEDLIKDVVDHCRILD